MKTPQEYMAEGDGHLAAERHEEAKRALLNYIFAREDEDPDLDYEFYLKLGACHYSTGYFDRALGCYDQALELTQDDPIARGRVYYERGRMYLEDELPDLAADDLKESIACLVSCKDSETPETREALVTLVAIRHAFAVRAAELRQVGGLARWPIAVSSSVQ